MWLSNLQAEWDTDPRDALRGTEVALKLLARMRHLLGDGSHWKSDLLATEWDGTVCNPLSKRAYRFSLGGGAARARWEMREELADAEISPVHVRQIMNAVFAVVRVSRGEAGGWSFAEAVLDGMRSALEQYRETQLAEIRGRRDAA